jgi:phospholipase C
VRRNIAADASFTPNRVMDAAADRPTARGPGSLPFPEKAAGTINETMPFDHLVVVMMENHSFDNLLGELSRTRPEVDGLTFDAAGTATNSNPGIQSASPPVGSFPLPDTAQAKNLSQSWRATHEQINRGAMDGFVRSVKAPEPMGYYTPAVLPFAYSLGNTFSLANRWFCSVPGPTYPNRRFLLAGTAYGGTRTGVDTLLDHHPPNGTIFDRLSDQHISWGNYFTDVPMTAVIPSIIRKHPQHHHPIGKFFNDCETGNLPAVSFVDPAVGLLSSIAAAVASLPSVLKDALKLLGASFHDAPPAETEEDPGDMYYGEAWAHKLVEAVLRSPSWSRTLLIYTYDEHGGYYDHVAPPAAVAPDDIPPKLQSGDPPGGYEMYGPRVPAVIVSPHSRPGGVSDVVHDHTSILATIEHKWNLPALTNRDANAATVMDLLDLDHAALLEPPLLQAPSATGPSGPTGRHS